MRHSLIINGHFIGTDYLCSDFGNVVSLIYESIF